MWKAEIYRVISECGIIKIVASAGNRKVVCDPIHVAGVTNHFRAIWVVRNSNIATPLVHIVSLFFAHLSNIKSG